MFSFYLFRRYFLSARSGSLIKVVAWICAISLAVSVAALILITSIMGGFGQAITSRLLSNEAHLVIDLTNDMSTHNKFKKLISHKKQEIKEVFFFEKQSVIIKVDSKFKGVVATGFSATDLKIQTQMEWPRSIHSTQTNQGIFVTHRLLSQLNLKVGDTLTLIPLKSLLLPPSMVPPVKQVFVKGIIKNYSQKNVPSIFYEKGSLDFGQYSQIKYGAEIQLHNPENYLSYANWLKDYKWSNWVDRNSTLFFALKLEKFIMILFIVLGILISYLGISSSLFLLMTQKVKDIGIFHSMGLSQKEIVKIFTKLGLYVALIGIILGFIIGILGSVFFKYNQWNILPVMYEDRTLPAILDWFSYLLILVSSLVLAGMACYLPTRYLSQIKVAELLKNTGR